MNNFHFLIENFFTHKDFLPDADKIPGTLFTPLQFVFEAILLTVLIFTALYIGKNKKLIKPTFIVMWLFMVVWEVVIVIWDTLAGANHTFDFTTNLSLYPCSLYLYIMPFAIWAKGIFRRIACGYIFTLGLLGALINFIFPIARLTDYSCISFAGFHTFLFHGAILFTFIVMLVSKYHTYTNIKHWWELFLPCIASIILSIPANLINYSKIDSDYMYFKGKFFVLEMIFHNLPEILITLIVYSLYIFIPALFYLPSYISNKKLNYK